MKKKIQNNGKEFEYNSRKIIEEIGPDKVYNTDQSGFNMEFNSGRTLHCVGAKDVLGTIRLL